MEKILNHIEHGKAVNLKELIQPRIHEVVSRILTQNDHISITLFGFDKGEQIATHASDGDALVTILEGSAMITIDDKKHEVMAGESIVMSANLPHALYAKESFKMILMVVFPTKKGDI